MQELKLLALQCLLDLLQNLHDFNFSSKIAENITYNLLSPDTRIREYCQQKLKQILSNKAHTLYVVKELVLKDMGHIYKTKAEEDIADGFMDVAVAVELDTRHLMKHIQEEERQKAMELKKKKAEYYKDKKDKSKSETQLKKRKKAVDEEQGKEEKLLKKELKQELKLGEAEMTPKEIARHNA